MSLSREDALAMLRHVMGPPKRELFAEEKDKMLTMLALMDPISESNNQRTFTEVYALGNNKYYVTYWSDEVTVEELIK